MHVTCLTQDLAHRKGFQTVLNLFSDNTATRNLPPTPHHSSSALPVRCSLEGCDYPPGVWIHSEELPLEDAMPLAGHEETGPTRGEDQVNGGPEMERDPVAGRKEPTAFQLHRATNPTSVGCLGAALVLRMARHRQEGRSGWFLDGQANDLGELRP
jgi:hypothetical protein